MSSLPDQQHQQHQPGRMMSALQITKICVAGLAVVVALLFFFLSMFSSPPTMYGDTVFDHLRYLGSIGREAAYQAKLGTSIACLILIYLASYVVVDQVDRFRSRDK